MSFWRNLFARFGEQKMTSLDLFRELYGGRQSKSGQTINWGTALKVTTALACSRVIAEGVAQVGFGVNQLTGTTRLPAPDHPLNFVLSRQPNGWQTSFDYRETIGLHLALTFNHYSYISRLGGRVIELIPFAPQWVTAVRNYDAGPIVQYRVTVNGAQKEFAPADIWHIRGPSWDSYVGMDWASLAREALGLALSTEEAHARLHGQGIQNSGVYTVDGTLNDKQHKELTAWIEAAVAGGPNAGKPLVLDRAAKWVPQVMNGVDAQHIETRKFQVEEICRAMRVMPIMVGYSDKASTYASAAQMFLAHLVYTMSPWYERIEQSADAQLLGRADMKAGFYTNFDEEGLLRATNAETAKYVLDLVNGGLLTPNEGRAILERNPDDDPDSDELRIPANIVGAVPEPTDTAPEPAAAAAE